MIYINFELTPAFSSLFDGEISPQRIIRLLEIHFAQKIIEGQTLLFFDEIQACERALTSLKYFAESAPGYHVVAAGSLLGVSLKREKYSFPVGKVNIETLHPLDFEEFLWANDKTALSEEIRNSFKMVEAMPDLIHKAALELVDAYLITGGMPSAVNEYVMNGDLQKVIECKSNILNAYVADMAKYASASECVKIRTAFDTIPAQLAKENHKFQYKLIKKGASSSHFGVAIDWLCSSGIVHKCSRINTPEIPLSVYSDLSAFKIYMSDTGLLTQKAGLMPSSILSIQGLQNSFKGALIENFVAQELAAGGHELYYWESDSIAEVDFVTNIGDKPIPVEVKSSDSVRSRSLGVYMNKYKPSYAVRISSKNFGMQNHIRAVPLYAVFAI